MIVLFQPAFSADSYRKSGEN